MRKYEPDGDTRALDRHDLPSGVQTHVLGSKFTRGGEPVDGTMPLAHMLLEEWEADCHFTQYTSDPPVRAVKGEANNYKLRFDFCCYDLDFDNHGRRPTLDDFRQLVIVANVIDHTPNVLYETRGGARFVYLIRPTSNPEWFESRYAAFMAQLAPLFINANIGYQLDAAVKDWPRLFRCPRVIRDGAAEYDRQVRLFHTRMLNLNGFRIKSKTARKVTAGNRPFTAHDPKLLRFFRTELVPGNRNNAIFAALCHVYRRYDGDAAAKWVECIHEAAINSGLDEAEFESVHNSAQKQPRGE